MRNSQAIRFLNNIPKNSKTKQRYLVWDDIRYPVKLENSKLKDRKKVKI